MSRPLLGDMVVFTLTGFRGIAMARLEWWGGGVQYIVQPTVDDNGCMRASAYVDAARLAVIETRAIGYHP